MVDWGLDVARLRIVADAGITPEFRDFNAFFWDFNLLYELDLLAELDPESAHRRAGSPWILARGGRPIPSDLRMRVVRSQFGSPIDITVLVPLVPAVVGALYVLAKSLERIYLIPATHRMLEAQARRENAKARLIEAKAADQEVQTAIREADFNSRLQATAEAAERATRGFLPIVVVERRLSRSPVQVTDFDAEFEGPDATR